MAILIGKHTVSWCAVKYAVWAWAALALVVQSAPPAKPSRAAAAAELSEQAITTREAFEHSRQVVVKSLAVSGKTITSINVAGGTKLTIRGTGFQKGDKVTIGNGRACLSVTVLSPFELTCIAAAH